MNNIDLASSPKPEIFVLASNPLTVQQNGDMLELAIQGNPSTIGNEPFSLRDICTSALNLGAKLLEIQGGRSDSGWEIRVPNADRLNTIREEKLAGTNVNKAKFIMHEGGLISAREYLTYFASRRIPIARDPEYIHHDYVHAVGFAFLSEEIFDQIVAVSKRALVRNDDAEIGVVVSELDQISGRASEDGEVAYIPRDLIKNKLFSGIKAAQLVKRQNQLASQIHSLARQQQALATAA